MKHVTILFTANRRRRALVRLGSLGIIHIEKKEEDTNAISAKIAGRFAACKRALNVLQQQRVRTSARHARSNHTSPKEHGIIPGEEIAKKIVGMAQRMEALQEETQRIAHHITDIRPWGSFKWGDIERLKEKGLHCHFYEIRKSAFRQQALSNAMVISRQFGKVYFVIISRTEQNELGYEESTPPSYNLNTLYRRQQEIMRQIDTLKDEFAQHAPSIPIIKTAYERLYQLNNLISARDAFHWKERIVFLRGFIPAPRVAELKTHATKMGWGLLIRDVHLTEDPPTLIVNPKSVTIVHPLYRLLGTLPGYREPEISALFLFFFVIFFAMIIGDGGYALLLIATALGLLLHIRNAPGRQAATLLLVVGIATLLWGAVSGNWFGAEQIAAYPFFARLVVPQLDAFDTRSIPFVQWACFMIALIHISIAHIWRAIYEWKHDYWLKACVNVGWIFLILGLYSLVVRLILSAFDFWYVEQTVSLIAIGVIGIVLFGKQERRKSFFIGVAKGIGGLFNTVLDGISSFADVISYLRLFAVGLASVEIARSFNQLAQSISGEGFSIVAAILLLAIGHSLNLAMGALSIIVHGVRLNMLEFSGHLGMDWSGIPYRPFTSIHAR